MNINIVSYATGRFVQSQQILEKQSYIFGANKVFSYSAKDIDKEFIKKNYKILSENRGGGYWCWKPYVINKAVEKIEDGEILIYVDSGAYPVNQLSLLPADNSINCFELFGNFNKHWTKYDCFHLMDCLEDKYINSYQILATFQVYKIDSVSRTFIKEYLQFCSEYQIISDSENKYGNNFEGFKDHRHDQSIFCNLCLKYNIKPHRDPSQWGNMFINYYSDSYPQIFNHHRGNIKQEI